MIVNLLVPFGTALFWAIAFAIVIAITLRVMVN
jgi:hypothetical protein